MHDVLIRGLSDEAYEYYKSRAKSFKRSVNAELKDVLERGVRRTLTREEALDKARALRLEIAERWEREGIKHVDSAEIIREYRDR